MRHFRISINAPWGGCRKPAVLYTCRLFDLWEADNTSCFHCRVKTRRRVIYEREPMREKIRQ